MPEIATLVAQLRGAGCVFAEDEARLLVAAAHGDDSELARLVARRVAGEPLEPLIGFVEFGGLHIAIAPGVFVPRRRTELLAEQAVADAGPGAMVVELCCGAAAVAAVLADRVAGLELHAVDIDPAATRCAARNVPTAQIYTGDLYAPLPERLRGQVDTLVANAPYVPTKAIELMPPEARDHEPRRALDGGPDGLAIQRRIIASAPGWLRPGGRLLIETSRVQAPATRTACERAGLSAHIVHDDERGATVVIGTAARPHQSRQ